MPKSLPRKFYRRDAVTVARALLGQRLVRVLAGQHLAGTIVETEAYLGVCDKAAHTYQGRRTPRNESMWHDGGHAYVYFTYGIHHCLNVVAGKTGEPIAVLIRALEPTEGTQIMYRHRRRAKRHADLCSGPGKLTEALQIDRSLDDTDLTEGRQLWIEPNGCRDLADRQVEVGPRIGVAYAEQWAERPLRFSVRDNPHVSKSR